MNCQKNVVSAVLIGVLAGTVLGAGTTQVAQVIARTQGIVPAQAEVQESAQHYDRVYRNTRSIRDNAEGFRESDTMYRRRSILQPFQELLNRVHTAAPSSFVDAQVPRECRGLVGRPLDRCVKRVNLSIQD